MRKDSVSQVSFKPTRTHSAHTADGMGSHLPIHRAGPPPDVSRCSHNRPSRYNEAGGTRRSVP